MASRAPKPIFFYDDHPALRCQCLCPVGLRSEPQQTFSQDVLVILVKLPLKHELDNEFRHDLNILAKAWTACAMLTDDFTFVAGVLYEKQEFFEFFKNPESLEVLENVLYNRKHNAFDAWHIATLIFAVFLQSPSSLEKALKYAVIPKCVLQRQLINALTFFWADGVQLFLSNGADLFTNIMNRPTSDYSTTYPLIACFAAAHFFGPGRYEQERFPVVLKVVLDQPFDDAAKRQLFKNALVHFGKSACKFPNAAAILIDKTFHLFDDATSQALLEDLLQNIAFELFDHTESSLALNETMVFLLRAGIRLHHLMFDWPEVLMGFACYISDWRAKVFDGGCEAQFFAGNPLQNRARLAILRKLPLGFKNRNRAIDKLNLPKMLNDYLKFSELEIND